MWPVWGPQWMQSETAGDLADCLPISARAFPGIITSHKGALVAFCDARMKRADDPPNHIHMVMKRSVDGGRIWGPLRTLAENGRGAVADSCGLVAGKTGSPASTSPR
jgi:hypothetical protein